MPIGARTPRRFTDGSRLGYLLAGVGLFHEAHRAADDCRAMIEILTAELPRTNKPALATLLDRARRKTMRIGAEQSPFDQKAESERLERIKLEAKLAPRSLDKQSVDRMINALTPLKGLPIDIVQYPSASSDVAPLALALRQIFDAAACMRRCSPRWAEMRLSLEYWSATRTWLPQILDRLLDKLGTLSIKPA